MAVSTSAEIVLIFDHGPDKGKSIPLTGPVTIGRHPANIISLKDLAVSRRHARIEMTPDGPYLVDLRSSNGVYVNDVRGEDRTLLLNGDRIGIGHARFLFHEK